MEHLGEVKAISAKNAIEWRNWLKNNHNKEKSVWLIIYKKESATPSVYYDEAVDEALCFGWIDSKPNKRDEESYYQFFAQRNPKSNWSKVNKEKVVKLIEEGKMEVAGMDMVNHAKQSGTWDALNEVENLVIPEDLEKELSIHQHAKINFENFPPSIRRGILEWIFNAKRDDTREKRIRETAELAEKNIRANQYKK